MSKRKGETKQGEKTYQIRPLFKDKFRPAVSQETIFLFFNLHKNTGSPRENGSNSKEEVARSIFQST